MNTHELAEAVDKFIESELNGDDTGVGIHQEGMECPGCRILSKCFALEDALKEFHRVDN